MTLFNTVSASNWSPVTTASLLENVNGVSEVNFFVLLSKEIDSVVSSTSAPLVPFTPPAKLHFIMVPRHVTARCRYNECFITIIKCSLHICQVNLLSLRIHFNLFRRNGPSSFTVFVLLWWSIRQMSLDSPSVASDPFSFPPHRFSNIQINTPTSASTMAMTKIVFLFFSMNCVPHLQFCLNIHYFI